jgi:Methyltransferase FkbM domain
MVIGGARQLIRDAIQNGLRVLDIGLIRASNLEHMKRELVLRHPGTPDQQQRFLQLAKYFQLVTVEKFAKIRLGRDGDGGYVMLDKLDGISSVLSFGIENEISWDLDMARRGCSIFMFDHTVDGPPEDNPHFHFYKKMIGPNEGPETVSIESALRDHGAPERRNVLKIDIEGAEWSALDATPTATLDRFSQIICEFHNFSHCSDAAWYARALRVMEKLNTHFIVVHVHGNNYSPYAIISNVPFPEVLEVTLVNRNNIKGSFSHEFLPSALDYPNNSSLPDLILGQFQFRQGTGRNTS